MTDDVFEPFRARLRGSLPTLIHLRESYIRLLAELPVSPHEKDMLEGARTPDFPTELRGILECVLADSLTEELIETLRQAAEYRPKGEG